jgi:hypothetical protein
MPQAFAFGGQGVPGIILQILSLLRFVHMPHAFVSPAQEAILEFYL